MHIGSVLRLAPRLRLDLCVLLSVEAQFSVPRDAVQEVCE